MVVPREGVDPGADWAERWEVIGRGARKEEGKDEQETGEKRKAEETVDQTSKRARLSPSRTDQEPTKPDGESVKPVQETTTPCKLPPPNPLAQRILSSLVSNPPTDPLEPAPKGDVFLLPDARENICTCPKVRLLSSHSLKSNADFEQCNTQVEALPFPLEEEDEYEPVLEDSPGTSYTSLFPTSR